MGQIVMIPDCEKPTFHCEVNGKRYSYPAGTKQEVPDEVAGIIENHKMHKPQPAPLGGAFSWNDLADKPFGETTVKGDTLTWDGNTEGLVSAVNLFYNVSNVIVSMSDLANGYTITLGDTTATLPSESVTEIATGVLMLPDASVWFVSEEGIGVVLDDGLVFTEAGVYFLRNGEAFTSSLTIPGYNGFDTITIQTIDAKNLPPLVSPSGKKFKLSVDDSGAVTATEV